MATNQLVLAGVVALGVYFVYFVSKKLNESYTITRPGPDLVEIANLDRFGARYPDQVQRIEANLAKFAEVYGQTFLDTTKDYETNLLGVMWLLLTEATTEMTDIRWKLPNDLTTEQSLMRSIDAVRDLGKEYYREAALRLGRPGYVPGPIGLGPGPFRARPADEFTV